MAKEIKLKSIEPKPIYVSAFDRMNEKGSIRGSISIIGGAIEKGQTSIGAGRIAVRDKDGNIRIVIGRLYE